MQGKGLLYTPHPPSNLVMYMLNTLPGGDPSQAPSFLLPPPGLNYIAAIQPSLTFVMIQISFGSMLIPLLTALICLSTREIRKKPVFYFNILAILSGLVSCTLSIWLQVRGTYPISSVSR